MAEKNWTQSDFLGRLVEGETLRRKDRSTRHRVHAARLPVIKTLEQFNRDRPKKINRPQVQNLFRLAFLRDKGNVVFMGGVGLGKTVWRQPWRARAAWPTTPRCSLV